MKLKSILLFLGLQVYRNLVTEAASSRFKGYDYTATNPIVTTKFGKVQGQTQLSAGNKKFYAFTGIPFAMPPVGSLRFKAPVPPNPWKGILDATTNPPMCIQKNYLFYQVPAPVEGSEDCLYLNVYTPKPSCGKKIVEISLPVMVFLHYGGFFAGTGNRDYLGPEYFMDKDVVLVTFNYRLGVFGFFSTNDDAAPGNWALKDQVAALRWVQENIEAFGGNPEKVTIFGESAGAGSAHLHQFSPASKGLFQQAISESGSALALWARPNGIVQAQVAQRQAVFVNCNFNDTEIMVECVRNVDAYTLADSIDKFKYFSTEPYAIYAPALEKRSPANPDPFIEEDPLTMLQSGTFNAVPWIVGAVEDEGILRASPLLRNSSIRITLNENFNTFGPQMFALSLSVPQHDIQSVWQEITDFYLQSDYVDVNNPNSVQGFINIYSDRSFNYGSYQSALLHAINGLSPVWFYKLNYRGEYSYGDKYAATTENIDFDWGVCHTDDLLYLFNSPALFPPLRADNDLLMRDCMIQMWTDFASTGDPSPRNSVANLKWEPLPNLQKERVAFNYDLHYLSIVGSQNSHNITFQMMNRLFPERMRFWKRMPLAENVDNVN